MSNLEIRRVHLLEASEAQGVVIVIDVIRAFSVAAYAFSGGAQRLWLVRSIEDAFALREREPKALLAGEVGGRLIPGFDFNNSPSLMSAANVNGRLLIQRTGAGTQGAVGAVNATHLLICSLVNAKATAYYAHKLANTTGGLITLFPTFSKSDVVSEDNVCADYLEALLYGQDDAQISLANKISQLEQSGRFDFLKFGDPDFPFDDIAAILEIDRFDFVMAGAHKHWQGITYVEVEKKDGMSQ
ncbi:MAG: 2-phosphosulfolactate phosphatase [Ktedonobacteraceae bacterium]